MRRRGCRRVAERSSRSGRAAGGVAQRPGDALVRRDRATRGRGGRSPGAAASAPAATIACSRAGRDRDRAELGTSPRRRRLRRCRRREGCGTGRRARRTTRRPDSVRCHAAWAGRGRATVTNCTASGRRAQRGTRPRDRTATLLRWSRRSPFAIRSAGPGSLALASLPVAGATLIGGSGAGASRAPAEPAGRRDLPLRAPTISAVAAGRRLRRGDLALRRRRDDDHRTRIQEPGAAGLQPHSADRRGLRRPRNAAVALPEAGPRQGRRQAQLPARIGGRRRALRPLLASSACRRARCCARAAFAPRSSPTARSSRRDDGNPLDFIAAYQQRFKVALRPGLPRFCGGLAGYFGYDTVRYIEPQAGEDAARPTRIGTPDILLLQCEELAVIDNLSGRLYLIVYADPAAARGLCQRQAAPARADATSCKYSRERAGRSSATPAHPARARVRQGRLPRGGASAPRSTSPPAT